MKEKIFGGIESYCPRDKARLVILPAPFELSTSYIKGTKKGPEAIIKASAYVELYDEELKTEPYRLGIHTAKSLFPAKDAAGWVRNISLAVKQILAENKFPVILGGEHTVSVGAIEAYQKSGFPNLSVLQFDAHADLRDSFEGSRLSHACAARRIAEKYPLTQVGIRSLSAEEAEFKKGSTNVTTFEASPALRKDTLEGMISSLTENVYITLDLDVFDPAFVPAVGTPEPGGLNWYEVLEVLRYLTTQKRVVGFDVVELCPLKGSIVSDFLSAKLIYKLIGYIFRKGG